MQGAPTVIWFALPTHLLDEAFFVHLGVCEAKLRNVASDSTLVLKKTLLWTLGYQRRGSVIAKRLGTPEFEPSKLRPSLLMARSCKRSRF
jgi:hypothetical protein